MWMVNKRFETKVTIINEETPIRMEGGLASIPTGMGVTGNVLWLPHSRPFIWDENGRIIAERFIMQVRAELQETIPFKVGATQILKDGKTYRIVSELDYKAFDKFRLSEFMVVRRIDVI